MMMVLVGILLISILLLMLVLSEDTRLDGLLMGFVLLLSCLSLVQDSSVIGLEGTDLHLLGLVSWFILGVCGLWITRSLGIGVWLMMDVGMVSIGLLCGLLGWLIGVGLGSVGNGSTRLLDVYECGPNAAVLDVLSLGWWNLRRIWCLYLLEALLCGLLLCLSLSWSSWVSLSVFFLLIFSLLFLSLGRNPWIFWMVG